ncbi:Uncharacterised protein [Turicibacter sanguinis]|nr:Uncharacterised protein [Turicibacter sanguinis]
MRRRFLYFINKVFHLAINYQSLIELLVVATSIDLNNYTNESVQVLNHVISQATEMIKANNSQQNEANQMVNQLQLIINQVKILSLKQ